LQATQSSAQKTLLPFAYSRQHTAGPVNRHCIINISRTQRVSEYGNSTQDSTTLQAHEVIALAINVLVQVSSTTRAGVQPPLHAFHPLWGYHSLPPSPHHSIGLLTACMWLWSPSGPRL